MQTVAAGKSSESVQSLARGLSVLRAFGEGSSRMTLSELSSNSDLPRATVRRSLITLVELGYVGQDERSFFLKPKLLELGFSYLSSLSFNDIVQKNLNILSNELHESASASVLDFPDVIYVARAATSRLMTIGLSVGTKLPALYTSMGRVMLSQLPSGTLKSYLDGIQLDPPTKNSISIKSEMIKELENVKNQGYCILDQELEIGLRSIAAPIGSHINDTYAAINISVPSSRLSMKELEQNVLPKLLRTAEDINRELTSVWPNA